MECSDYEERFYKNPNRILRQENDKMLELLRKLNLSGSRCLDFGCGTGYWTSVIHCLGARCSGADSSEERIEQCRTRFPGINFLKIDEEGVRFERGLFDFILCAWVLQEIESDASLARALEEFQRLAKRGGKIMIVDNVYPDSRTFFQGTFYGDLFFQKDEPGKLRFFPLNTVAPIMNRLNSRLVNQHFAGDSFFEIFEKC